ncbi:putative hydroxyacylglutathione hydrolase C-terminus [Lyophyllum shimeji]|uniref:hydroxyacylglutathione hydrolase n=1 Tax=Lyophyllum shimeji TaxID=47721 RepID=A0A9P3PFL2_LYOSH|nr:putative hydroxyacylglutathione hydrolase C-terminus [Lyophyllum shimeji]
MRVVPVPVREDNYAYLLIDETSKTAAAIDPFDVPKVTAAAKDNGVRIVAAIATHHHFDHSGGNKDFAEVYPDAPIYGGSSKVLAIREEVRDKHELFIGDHIKIKCLATPCHTRDSYCYYATDQVDKDQPGGVFTGDTLFIAGCGRFFEGTADEMDRALKYLATLPDNTMVYNGHEYTSGNLKFARTIEPNNPALDRLAEIVKHNKITTGLTTMGDEKEWNVFMRLDSDDVKAATAASDVTPDADIMNALRNMKNRFRG